METLEFLHSWSSPFLDRIIMAITNAGSEQAYIALLIVMYLGVSAKGGRHIAMFFLLSMMVNEQLKQWFDVARPFAVNPDVVRIPEAIITADGPSFPSGHAQAATTFWGTAALFVQRRWFWVLAIVLTLLIGFSRMYLGVHYPADVIVGTLVGAAIVGIAALFKVWRLPGPTPLLLALGIAVPFVLHLVFESTNSGMFMGAMGAFIIGPELSRYTTKGQSLAGRIILCVFGVLIIFATLFLLRGIMPSEVRHSTVGSYVFYFAIGIVGTVGVPFLGRALGLVRPSPKA